MALISLRQLLDHAAEHRYGVPAFNVNNMEQIQAIMQAAEATDAPVILQASAGARKYAGEPFLRKLVEAAIEQYPQIPVCLHQDHGASPAVCLQAMRSGFSSVMMDGSLLRGPEDAGELRLQRRRDAPRRRHGARDRRQRRRRTRLPGLARDRPGRRGGRRRRRRHAGPLACC